MREIKFRYVFRDTCTGHKFIRHISLSEIELGVLDQILRGIASRVSNEVIIIHRDQYTGLKDKNGKEIYKGDIVVVVREDVCYGVKNYSEKVVVEGPCYNELEDSEHGGPDGNDSVLLLTIIGNIHENPELSEG